MNTDILDKADSLGLDVISTTPQSNGYPIAIKRAIIGFETFEQAEIFAKENGLSIEKFYKKTGWDVWVRSGDCATEPFYIPSLYEDDDNYECLYKSDIDSFTDRVKDRINEMDDINDMQDAMEKYVEIWNELICIEDDEFILVKSGEYSGTIDKYATVNVYDGSFYAIGVI